MKFRCAGLPQEFEVEVTNLEDGRADVRIGTEQVSARLETAMTGSTIIRIGTRAIRVFSTRRGNSILVAAGPAQYEFVPIESGTGRRARGLATPEVVAPMPGKVIRVLVSEGQRIEAGTALVVLEAMKMETVLTAESAAAVKKIRVSAGAMVDHGAVLLELSPPAPSSPKESAPRAR
jgi:acetyl/propionyl-CoA carboxylase alpha subunit